MGKGYKLVESLRYNYLSFVANQVENIKHQDHVFQKPIGWYYRGNGQRSDYEKGEKPNVAEEAINHPNEKNLNAINETDKPQASQSEKDKSIRNESNKGISLDKSR